MPGCSPVRVRLSPSLSSFRATPSADGLRFEWTTASEIGNVGFYDVDFEPLPGAELDPAGHGLRYIDHLTHNVHKGRMKEWADFYERLFNFREVRYFDIEGKLTGLKSKAMTSPCGKIRIPINESMIACEDMNRSTWSSMPSLLPGLERASK